MNQINWDSCDDKHQSSAWIHKINDWVKLIETVAMINIKTVPESIRPKRVNNLNWNVNATITASMCDTMTIVMTIASKTCQDSNLEQSNLLQCVTITPQVYFMIKLHFWDWYTAVWLLLPRLLHHHNITSGMPYIYTTYLLNC